MSDGQDAAGSAPLRPHEVEVRMLAAGQSVPGIRALAADMAMHEDFDLDAISDVRLAVEEACATVLANADPAGLLVCRVLVSATDLEISAFVTLADGREPSVGPLSLRILRTLSDSVDYWTSTADGRRLFHVALTKSAV
ncbi:MAG TPA: ATP-binding protein [Pseudonocardiaceae bacterium]|nr:ATP-binding protein [Pseudonocardiaceae bacterium]